MTYVLECRYPEGCGSTDHRRVIVVSNDTNTVLLLVPVVIVLLVSAAVPAYLVWLTAPPVGGEFFPYVRLGAAMITAIVGAFLGAFILQSAVSIVRSIGDEE